MKFDEWFMEWVENQPGDKIELNAMQLARISFNAGMKYERDECARVIEEIGSNHPPHGHHYARCLAAICARDKQ